VGSGVASSTGDGLEVAGAKGVQRSAAEHACLGAIAGCPPPPDQVGQREAAHDRSETEALRRAAHDSRAVVDAPPHGPVAVGRRAHRFDGGSRRAAPLAPVCLETSATTCILLRSSGVVARLPEALDAAERKRYPSKGDSPKEVSCRLRAQTFVKSPSIRFLCRRG
jgi:hypothetical protein